MIVRCQQQEFRCIHIGKCRSVDFLSVVAEGLRHHLGDDVRSLRFVDAGQENMPPEALINTQAVVFRSSGSGFKHFRNVRR